MLRPFVLTLVTLFVLSWLLPAITFTNLTTLLIAGVVLTLLNGIVKPVLKLLLLPINLITFGLFSIFLNAGILWLALAIVPGFHIDSIVLFGLQFGQLGSLVLVSACISSIHSVAKTLL
ncbi:MAG: phage holin family protein [bacterium]|nr:phage holin family protein [bacterium]